MTRDPTWLASHLRDVPDFPTPGIVFKDLTPLLADVDAFRYSVDAIADHAAGLTIDKVVGVEARGFIFGAAVAYPDKPDDFARWEKEVQAIEKSGNQTISEVSFTVS